LGQTLIVTSGMGGVQTRGGPKEEIRAGIEKHWHGATAITAMTHIAMSEALDGKTVDGMEKVSDAEFNG
jgi:quercetin dioxygenase-like cupin family protein